VIHKNINKSVLFVKKISLKSIALYVFKKSITTIVCYIDSKLIVNFCGPKIAYVLILCSYIFKKRNHAVKEEDIPMANTN